METIQSWLPAMQTLVISIVLPFVIAFLKRCNWSDNAKRWFAYGLSAAVAIIVGLMNWPPTPETLITTTLASIGGVQVVYAAFKSIGVTSNLLDSLDEVGTTYKVGGTDE